MKIHSMTIQNFRGYRDATEIPFHDLTVFVGKNDVGKSTILEALDIFFHDGKGTVKIEKKDVNVQEKNLGNTDIVISVTFDELPGQIVLDTASPTSLQSEYLLNSDGRLEVCKVFRDAGVPKVFIKAVHPANEACAGLLLKKNSDLKKIVREHGISCENLASNVCLRKAIWRYFAEDLQLQDVMIDASKEDAKAIWENLANYMPVYSLFQSDRKNSDGDSEVQDPLQEAVKEIISDPRLQAAFTDVANEVTRKLQEVSDRTLAKIREMDCSIANSLNPDIPPANTLKWADVFKKVSITGDGDIPINKRGSGVKRLVLLNFFRAEAERRLEEGNNTGIIYAIEEPETSQHAANQKILIQALKTLADTPNVQVILTTHSGIIVKHLQFGNLRMVTDVNGQKSVQEIEPGVLLYPSLNEVNYLAYGEAVEEYHDELYGFLDYHQKLNEYKRGKEVVPYTLDNHGTPQPDPWHVTMTEYIRHQIHHPENRHNPRFTPEQLLDSINAMRAFIQTERNVGRL